MNVTNVTDYGAIPNDGLDDTAAINAAVAAGTSIYFPPGSYKYTGRITLPANKSYRLYGDGPGVSIIAFTGPNAGIYAPTIGAHTLNVEGLSLQANTAAAGTAIYAAFSDPAGSTKFHTATIHNVVIVGSTRDGITGGYWTTGIYLNRAQNAVVDGVDISGNTTVTATGIVWTSPTTIPTTGIQISNTEIKWCNIAVQTSGWVEGFYMSGFEVVLCGTPGYALDLLSSQSGSPSPAFNLINGHVSMLAGGVKMTNLSAIKISNVDFSHVAGSSSADGTFVSLNNTIGAIIFDCTFGSQITPPISNENGVFLTNAKQTRISGNIFRLLQPTLTGSAIVPYTGTDTVRVTDNIFKTVKNIYDNNYGATNFYYGADNFVQL
jgi:hypothetical protein